MGIFSRFRDIVNANINAMLEKAEDPEKLLKLMIQEMEDTQIELKASCAGAMASKARVERGLSEARERAERWAGKARLAMEKGREDLAREALQERRAFADEATQRESELARFDDIVSQYRADIEQLEEKIQSARNKHRVLVQRHIAATRRKAAQTKIREHDAAEAMARFESFEQRIDRMEAEASLVNHGRKPSLEEEFSKLEKDDDLEKELANLRNEVKGNSAE